MTPDEIAKAAEILRGRSRLAQNLPATIFDRSVLSWIADHVLAELKHQDKRRKKGL